MDNITFFLFISVLFAIAFAQLYPTEIDTDYTNTSVAFKDIAISSNNIFLALETSWSVYNIPLETYTFTQSVNQIYKIAVLSDGSWVVPVVKEFTGELAFYNFQDGSYVKINVSTSFVAEDVSCLKLIYNSQPIAFVAQAQKINVIKKNDSNIYAIVQMLNAGQSLFDLDPSSDGKVIVAASKRNIFCYVNTPIGSYDNYVLQQTIYVDQNNTRGVLDLSADGSLLAYVANITILKISKDSGSYNDYTNIQTISDIDQEIRQIKISQQKWLIVLVVGNSKIKVYANNTGNFQFIQNYEISEKILKIDISSDNNYIVIGTNSSTHFKMRISSKLYQKTMISHAQIIFFVSIFGGVALIILISCIFPKPDMKISMQEKRASNHQQYNDLKVGQIEDTQLHLTRPS